MHLGIDHAWQQVKAAAVHHLAGRCMREVADGCDHAACDRHVAQAFAVVVHDRAAPEDEVVAHDGSSWPPRGAGMMSRPPSRGPS
jgi:hypothetical protein